MLRSSSATFMYRDFQSRNVMIKDGAPWFIDFQGGRKGPFFYDVASFLWQAKAKFPETLRNELLEEYIDALSKYKPVDRDYFFSQLRHFVLFRTLQVLGPTVSVAISKRSHISSKVYHTPSRTCDNCFIMNTPNIPTCVPY